MASHFKEIFVSLITLPHLVSSLVSNSRTCIDIPLAAQIESGVRHVDPCEVNLH